MFWCHLRHSFPSVWRVYGIPKVLFHTCMSHSGHTSLHIPWCPRWWLMNKITRVKTTLYWSTVQCLFTSPPLDNLESVKFSLPQNDSVWFRFSLVSLLLQPLDTPALHLPDSRFPESEKGGHGEQVLLGGRMQTRKRSHCWSTRDSTGCYWLRLSSTTWSCAIRIKCDCNSFTRTWQE